MTHCLTTRLTRRLATLVSAFSLVALAAAARPAGAQLRVAAKYQPVAFDLLSSFDIDMPDPLDPKPAPPNILVPDPVKALNGRLIALRGFMLPLDLDAKGVSKFMLNASLDMCYFGAPVRFNDWVMVTMPAGKKAKFSHLPTNVTGRFEVGQELKNGRIVSLYRMAADDAEIVK